MTRPIAFTALTLLAFGASVAAAQDPRPRERPRPIVRINTRDRDDDRGEYVAKLDTTIAFSKTGVINVTLPRGETIVTGWAQDRVQVRATSESDNIRFDATSSRLTLETSGSRGSSDTRFELMVPVGVHVSARSQNGDITIRGTKGEIEASAQNGDIRIADAAERLEVNTLSGDVEVDRATGDVELHSVSGDMRLRDIHGDIEAETVSGDVEIRGAVAKYVRAKTTSGDVSYDGSIDAAGRYELTSHSGDVDVTIPDGTGAQLTVSTWSGSVESDFPMTLKPGEHGIGSAMAKRFTFAIGDASSRVTLESFSGDITINKTSGRTRR